MKNLKHGMATLAMIFSMVTSVLGHGHLADADRRKKRCWCGHDARCHVGR